MSFRYTDSLIKEQVNVPSTPGLQTANIKNEFKYNQINCSLYFSSSDHTKCY